MRNWIQSNSQSVSRALLMFIVLINLRESEEGVGGGGLFNWLPAYLNRALIHATNLIGHAM